MQPYKFSEDGFHRIIRYKGIFDFDGLYKFIVKWIKERDFDFYERRVIDKPPYTIYHLEGRKKVNFYVMHLILPELWVWDAQPVEVIKDGHVQHLTQARMKIVVDGGFITDYDGDFESSDGKKALEAFLNGKILYHENFLKVLDYLDYYLYGFMQDVKAFLEMETATNAY